MIAIDTPPTPVSADKDARDIRKIIKSLVIWHERLQLAHDATEGHKPKLSLAIANVDNAIDFLNEHLDEAA